MKRAHFLHNISLAVVFAFSLLAAGGEAVAASALPRLAALGPDLEGAWDGLLQTNSGSMPVSFSITTVDGKSTVALDILEQNARDIPVTGATREGAKVHFDIAAVDGAFDGALTPDGLQGTWAQAGKRVPLTLKRRSAESVAR